VNVRRSIHRGAAVAALLAAAPLLSSCGFNAATNMVYNPAEGVGDQSGMVDVLNVLVVSDEDGSGTLVAGLANNNQVEADELVDVRPGGNDRNATVEVTGATEIPPGELLDLSDAGGVTLSGDNVVPGSWITLTFAFQHAASITVEAPVVDYESDGPYHHVPVG
jgi:hypothetical protein